MTKGFKILQKNPYEDTEETIKNYYSSWRDFNKGNGESREKFTMLFTSFKDSVLPNIDGGPLRLYLFFCFNAGNSDGGSWYSIDKIANHLKVGTRTINKWIKTLTDSQLIYREQGKRSRSMITYLLPYSTTLMEIDTKSSFAEENQELVEKVITSLNMQNVIFGDLIGVFHLFQWRVPKTKESKKSKDTRNTQWLLFITKRTNGILTGHYVELKNSGNNILSQKNIKDSYFFRSPFNFQENPILGIALDNETDITDNPFEPLKDLIEYLPSIDIDKINSKQFVEYGVTDKFEETETDDTE